MISTLIFIIGIIMLLVSHMKILDQPNYHTLIVIIALILICAGWILRERELQKEKFDNLNYARIQGDIVGGTVYASYPDQTPGLGWIN